MKPQKLCLAYGKPLVSTSANLSGQPALVDAQSVRQQLGHLLADVVEGPTDRNAQPSTIIDAISGKIYRA